MERSEPTLVPEWLKSTGSMSGGGSTTHHFALSSLHSDDQAIALPMRNRSSVSTGDYDSPRSSVFSDRTSSSFHRSSSGNGPVMHVKDPTAYSRSYGNFSRSHRDRDCEKDLLGFHEKERSVLADHRDHDCSDLLGISANVLTSRIEKDSLRRSQSMISGKRGEVWPRRVAADSNSGNNNNYNNNNHVVVGGSIVGSIHKATFERDFPSLGAEERQGAPDIGRVSYSGLNTGVHGLPIGTSSVIGGDGWTSALAEVPVIIGTNSMVLSSVQQNAPASLATVAPTITTGLNMAETLAQAPSRVRTSPQLSVETQRLEELAIKQSRQLIPMTPSTPKTSVLNLEKPKPKSAARGGEMNVASKIGQQQVPSSHLVNHSLRGGAARSDVAKTSQVGKLLVLKAAHEKNGISPTAKDGLSLTNAGRVTNNLPAVAPLRSPNNPKLAVAERKPTLPFTHSSPMEKRPTMSQAQSRNDFFNLMRKKTSVNLSSAAPDPSPVVSSTDLETSGELIMEVATTPVSPQGSDATSSDPSCLDWSIENGVNMASNGDACEESQRCPNNGEKHSCSDADLYPDEEEAAFLRSLGWEENAGEEEGLTEEEINAFYKEYVKSRPSMKLCHGMHQQKLLLPLQSHLGNIAGVSTGLSSSNSESKA